MIWGGGVTCLRVKPCQFKEILHLSAVWVVVVVLGFFFLAQLKEDYIISVSFSICGPELESEQCDLTKPTSCVCLPAQDSDVFKYHVIVNELLFPDHLTDGLLKSTMLGSDYQVQFHLDSNNQVMTAGSPQSLLTYSRTFEVHFYSDELKPVASCKDWKPDSNTLVWFFNDV